MARQTYDGPLQWIVVDDGEVGTDVSMGQRQQVAYVGIPCCAHLRLSVREAWRCSMTGVQSFMKHSM